MFSQFSVVAFVFIVLSTVVGFFSIGELSKYSYSNQLLPLDLIINRPLPQNSHSSLELNTTVNYATISDNIPDTISIDISIPEEETIEEAKRFALFSGIAYCPIDTLREWNCQNCLRVGHDTEFLEEAIHTELDLRVIVAVDNIKREIILSFRGSNSIHQALGLMGFSQVVYNNNPDHLIQNKFSQKMLAILPGAKRILNPLLTGKYSDYRLVVTGHSLGGAIAVLVAPLLKDHFNLQYENLAVYTYGQPRVGNLAFAQWYSNLPMTMIRTVNGRDSIPHTPFGSNYLHTNRELYLTDGHRLCASDLHEDPTCSGQLYPLPSLAVHGQVWDIPLGKGSC